MSYKLDPVQEAALDASDGHDGFGYFMEMGLGKTLTAFADFLRALERQQATRMVIFCPNSFKGGWLDEFEKHGIDGDMHLYDSGSSLNEYFIGRQFNRPPFIVVNYEAARSGECQRLIRRFASKKPTFCVFDESIQLKTHDSQQTKACIGISQVMRYKRILTGKPTTQGPHDLWGQMRAIGHLDGKNYFAFRNLFCRMGGFKNKQVIGAQNEDYLATLIEPHVFRALKADWLPELPPKRYTIREYKMSPEQRNQYNAMEHEFVLWLTEDKSVSIDAAITKYEKLQQIQCGFIIDENKKVHELVPIDRNPRILTLLDILDQEVIGKVIIVYVHRHSAELLGKILERHNPAFIRGNMDATEIEKQKHRFANDHRCRHILVQAIAGKYGHTLLGGIEAEHHCSTTIFFENSYSLDTRSQLEDRSHRRGQKADSVIYIDLCGTSQDRNVLRALQRKEDIFQAIMRNIKRAVPA